MIYDKDGKLDLVATHKCNCDHADNPRVGDYWSEFFMPVAVILGRPTEDTVLVCRETKPIKGDTRGRTTWDLSKCKVETVAEFSKYIRYDSIPDKCWADVDPESMKSVREAAIEQMFGKAS